MADIFDEIDEELKKDKAKLLWARYGKFVIAAVAAKVALASDSQQLQMTVSRSARTNARVQGEAFDAASPS